MRKKTIALVLGGYVNGYSIIRELNEAGVNSVWLFDYGKSLARQSSKILGVTAIEKNLGSLRLAILALKEQFDYIVCYPTDDLQLELLKELSQEISEFCFIPFNDNNLSSCLDKYNQYQFCEKLGVPYPKTVSIEAIDDIKYAGELLFPVLIKPNKREDLTSSVFRSLYVESMEELLLHFDKLNMHLNQGVSFLASECIPGDDTNIYAYMAYRSKGGIILNEWTGKKLTQFPDLFGVFSSASNEAPEIVRDQGRALLEGMNLTGIAEPEFKYDARDNKYKLMEINLRSMMWHRVGSLSGVHLHYTQWLDSAGQDVARQNQEKTSIVHFVYMKHELANLLSRPSYIKHFLYNVFHGERRCYAVFNKNDLKPFFYDLTTFPRALISVWLKVLRTRFGKS